MEKKIKNKKDGNLSAHIAQNETPPVVQNDEKQEGLTNSEPENTENGTKTNPEHSETIVNENPDNGNASKTDENENDEDGNGSETDEKLKNTVILIFNSAESLELFELSAKQWMKNLPDYPILVAGGKFGELGSIKFEGSSDKDVNLANILAAIVADDEISEQFILSPVGTFPVNPVAENDFTGLHCVSVGLQSQELTCMKNVSELACTKQLKKEGWTNVYNYETGLPVLMEKAKISELFDKFNPQKLPTKVMSLYLNYFNKDEKPVPVHFGKGVFATRVLRKNPSAEAVKKALQGSKFFTLNNDGYEAVKDFFTVAE